MPRWPLTEPRIAPHNPMERQGVIASCFCEELAKNWETYPDVFEPSIRGLTVMRTTVSALSVVLLALAATTSSAAGIRGDYVEARTADVFTGPCFSNAEIFISGNRAVMAWKVTEGSWNGVDLRGSALPPQ